MTVDLILVGPWSRLLHEKVLLQKYANYFLEVKKSKRFNKIIYSCSESSDKVDSKYFDLVLINPVIDKSISSTLQNQNTNNLIENSRAGVLASNAEFVVKVRSDLIFSGLDVLLDAIFLNKSKLIVDYEIQHSLLIPYYYPDFLIAGRRSQILNLFQKFDQGCGGNYLPNFFSFSPMKLLTIGRLSAEVCYTEYAIWSRYLYKINVTSSLKPMCDLNFIDLKNSFSYLKGSICFINRRVIFSQDGKFIFPLGISHVFFDQCSILNIGLSFYFLLTYHYILYIKRSICLVLQKLFA
jgi:hypothetical protein